MSKKRKSKNMPNFMLARTITQFWKANMSYNVMIYGQTRVGKSSYAIQNMIDLYGKDEWLKYMVFTKRQFIDLAKRLLKEDKKVPAIMWDDAGIHLFALDWSDRDVKEVVKILQVVNIIACSIIFTMPAVDMVVKKITRIEGIRVGKIVRPTSAYAEIQNTRQAWVYRNNILVNGKRIIRKEFIDVFNVMLPNDVYEKYYPIRKMYLAEGIKSLEEKAIKKEDISLMAQVSDLKKTYLKESATSEEITN